MRTIASFLFLGLATIGSIELMKRMTGADTALGMSACVLAGAALVLAICQYIRSGS